LIESYEYRLLVKDKITRSNWEAVLSERQQEYASNDAHAGFTLYKKLELLLPLLPTPPERGWYSFDAINGRLCRQDNTQWHAENPNYDPGPSPPPRPPREVKASMIINAESNGEPSASKARNASNGRKRKRNYLASTSQPSAGRASDSTQQQQPRGLGTYGYNPQPLPKNSGQTFSQHRPTGAQGTSSAQRRVPSSNIGNGLGQSIEQAQTDRRRPRRRP